MELIWYCVKVATSIFQLSSDTGWHQLSEDDQFFLKCGSDKLYEVRYHTWIAMLIY